MSTGVPNCRVVVIRVWLVVVTSLVATRVKSMSSPQASLIKPLECKNLNNQTETGICMFSIDCMQSKGVPLSVCKHNYFVGTCCKLPNSSEHTTTQHTTTQLPTTTTTRQDVSTLSSTSAPKPNSTETTQSAAPKQEAATGSSPKPEERYVISSMSLFLSSQSIQTNTTRPQLPSTTTAESARNVEVIPFRETQRVCGRPQVQPGDARKRIGRIVGGNQSMFGQWPWIVSLRQWRRGAFLHKCGAALLNEKWAITAAHCVENVKASDLLLRLGEFDVSNQEEPYPYIERRVKTVVAHPSFDPKTFEYDLALLKFAEPVKYERNIVPVCVPTGNDSYVDRMATVIGWGRLYEDGPLPDVIQHVDVPIITNKECEKMYKNAGYIEEIPQMFICAGISKGGRDSCEGDSGGPLTMVDHDGRSYLVGIISWGIGCALPSQPGVYTRITSFSRWITQITDF